MSGRFFRIPARLVIGLWLSLLTCLPEPAAAQPAVNGVSALPARQVLILESMRPGFSDADFRRATIVQSLIDHGINRSDIRVEYLDLDVNRDTAHRNNLIGMLQHKFDLVPPALIVTDQRPAYDFLNNEGAKFHPRVPVLAFLDNVRPLPVSGRPWMQIVEESGLQATAALIMRVLPNTRHLLVVVSDGTDVPVTVERIQTAVRPSAAPPIIELTHDLSYEQMLHRVGALGKGSVVLFPGDYIRDRNGRSFASQDVATEVGKAASVPVFGTRDVYVQNGFFGGRAVDAVATGRLAANLILEHVARRQPFPSAGLTFPAISRDMIDWRQLLRWQVTRKRLPDTVHLVNRPLPLLQRYPVQILSGFTVTAFAVMLIVLLMQQRQQRGNVPPHRQPDDELLLPITLTKDLEAANQRLAMLSFVDDLTGLANRRHLDNLLSQECQRANRSGQPLSLIMVDVDHFKEFNDRYGHLAGDECLKSIARLLNGICQRPADLACRFGGEEFLIILPETAHRGALKSAQTLWRAIEKSAIRHDMSTTAAHVTCSIGVLTSSSPPARSPRELLALVDNQLYQAKKSGRNVICSSDLSHPLPDQAQESGMFSLFRQSYRDDCAMRCLKPDVLLEPPVSIAVGKSTPA